jgi:lipopolysaccharide export LptBFGC system permease protein LptF
MQSCGVSIYQLLRPLAVVALAATAGTAYIMIIARPDANQAFRELVFKEVASRVESKIQSRVLFDQFPSRVLYVREVDAAHVMHDVFFADTSKPGTTTVSFAREGRFIIDRAHQVVQLQLADGTQHDASASQTTLGELLRAVRATLDAQAVFKRARTATRRDVDCRAAPDGRTAKPNSDLSISAQYDSATTTRFRLRAAYWPCRSDGRQQSQDGKPASPSGSSSSLPML